MSLITTVRRAASLAFTAAAVGALAVAPSSGQPVKTGPGPKGAAAKAETPAGLIPYARERIDSILKIAADGGDLKKAAADAAAVMDQCIAWGNWGPSGGPDVEALVIADGAVRMLRQLGQAPKDLRTPLLTYLRANPVLAAELAFAISKKDDIAGAYRLLDKLRQAAGDRVAQHPSLAAAMCVVYDKDRIPRALARKPGPKPAPMDPVLIFAHFVQNQGRLVFPLDLAPEVLVYMVATDAEAGELDWALQKHAGDHNVGKRYKDIVYDTAFFKFDKPKKIEALPYTLQNIAKVGGVCEEQAYYAAHVAKAIGVPAASIYGRSGDDAHAWVGFLQDRGGAGPVWNMDEGHYDDYENLEGMVIDPQTGDHISDSQLAMTAEAVHLSPSVRHSAIALIDAQARLGELLDAGGVMPPAPEGVHGLRSTARVAGDAARLEMLKAAVSLAPCCPRAWEALMALTPRMSSADRSAWFDALAGGCGVRYPRYAYHIIAAMIDGIPSAADQSGPWDWAYQKYHRLPDLAADARLRQGKAWEKAGDKDKAFQAFTSIARDFPNDGPFVVDALDRAEDLLKKAGKDAAAVEMYKDAWRRISRPETVSPAIFRRSNFYRVGERYAEALERCGRTNEAQTARHQLGAGVDKAK